MATVRLIAPVLLARARLVRGIVPNVTVAAMLGMGEREFYRRREALGLAAKGRSSRRVRNPAGGSKHRHPESLTGNRKPLLRHAEERARPASRSRHQRRASFERPAPRVPQDDAGGSVRAPRAQTLPILAGHGEPVDRLAVGRAMERFISARVAAYETAAGNGNDPEPERTARTIAHYARALGLVRDYLNEIEKERSIDGEQPLRTLSELRDELRGHLERIWDEGADAGGLRGAGDEQGGD